MDGNFSTFLNSIIKNQFAGAFKCDRDQRQNLMADLIEISTRWAQMILHGFGHFTAKYLQNL